MTGYMRDPNNLITINMFPSLFWASKIDGIRVGSGTFANGFPSQYATPKSDLAIFDTGTSLMYLPASKLHSN